MSHAQLFAAGILLAWLAGLRVYLTVFGIGLAGWFGWLDLPPALQVAQSPWAIGVSGGLALVEFFTDKIPGVDSAWDLLHTLLRVPAGAFLAAAAVSPDGDLGTGMLAAGAGTALASHLLKAGTRAALNVSPEPVSNWTASLGEDAVVVTGLALAFAHPFLALSVAVTASLLLAAAVWWLWRWMRRRLSRRSSPAGSSARRGGR